MTMIASTLEGLGYILRSGGADGADSAFEAGVKDPEKKEIYLPWRNFNGNPSLHYIHDDEYFGKVPDIFLDAAKKLAEKYHPAWSKLKHSVKRMMIRNIWQVAGIDLYVESDFVVCWTKYGSPNGGTGQAIRYAMDRGIKVYNLYIDWELKELCEFVKGLKNAG
jgi:hypothetical protein